MKDLLTFFVYRCYCAQRESVIPWSGLRDQFPQDDNNPRRLKSNVTKAIKQLLVLWPEVRIDVIKAPMPLLPDDPSKKRIRRLDIPPNELLPGRTFRVQGREATG